MDVSPIIRTSAVLAALGATGLGALGRFPSALALTLGAVVAIVSALWLSGFVSRLRPSPREDRVDGRSAAGIDRTYGLKAALRYALAGLVLFGAVRWLPREIPWLLAGLSVVVAALAVEMVKEVRQTARGRQE